MFSDNKPNAELELLNIKISEVKAKLYNAKMNLDYKGVLETEVELEKLNNKKQELEKGNKGNFFSSFFSSLKKVTPSLKNVSGMTIKIKNTIKQWSGGMKQGLGHVLKYAGALFSLRSIYSTLSSSARSWLSSQNAQAQQLSANIDYMKYAMGSVFAPVIQYVTNLVYSLMKAVQSLVYAFSGVNIFAKATASSMNSASSSASKTSKSLSGIHNEINNVSDNDSSGSSNTSPSIDLSQMDTEMNPLSQKLYDFFKPLVESWNTYGSGLIERLKTTAGQIGELISSVWKSFEKIITNGIVSTILENILVIIGNIAEAFSNAWKNDGNGDAIIQNLANALNNVLDVIKKITESTFFQWILDVGVSAIGKLTEAVEWVTQKIDEFVGFLTGSEDDLSIWAIMIGSLATAIGLVTIATTIYKAVKAKETAVLIANAAAWVAANLPIILIVAAITAVIAIIILCIKHWDEIKETISNVCNTIKETISNWAENIGEFFSNLWQKICDIFGNVGQWFSDKFNSAVEGIKNAFSSIGSFFSDIWQGICNTFGNVANWFKDKFSQAWQAVKNVFNTGGKIFDGIKDGILSGLKSVINAIISGINKVISIPFNGINSALKKIRDINILGVEPFKNLISTINVPQIPQLAKGNVAYSETLAIFGEYSGANSNPEITTPQNIMRDTFEDVLSDFNSNNGQPLHITIQYLGKEIFDDTIDYINSKTRRTGKNTIVMVGD